MRNTVHFLSVTVAVATITNASFQEFQLRSSSADRTVTRSTRSNSS